MDFEIVLVFSTSGCIFKRLCWNGDWNSDKAIPNGEV